MNYKQHPLSSAFPAMEKDAFKALVADIRQHGQRDIATLYDGMVLDGWHRYTACDELNIPCRLEKYEGDDALSFVKSKNQHRRHYEKSQRAAIVISLNAWAVAGNQAKGEPGSPLATNLEMASDAGTTVRTIQQAKRAHEAGLSEPVRDGKISAKSAAELAKKAPELAKQVVAGEISPKKAVEQLSAKKPKEVPVDESSGAPSVEEIRIGELEMRLDAVFEEKERIEVLLSAGALPEDERADFKERMDSILAENKQLRIMNDALTISRDRLMNENAAMQRQLKGNLRKIKELEKLQVKSFI